MARFLLDDGRNEEYAVRRDALRAIADEHCAIGVEWLIMLLRDAPSMNQCVSPTSLVLCLDLLSRATKGRTRNELGAVIRETQVHMQVLRENILCSEVLKIGNAIWSNRRILSYARRRFEEIGATVGIFSSAEQLRADSSDWVSGVTDGRIRDVFAYIPDQTFLALANVIAFKDDWRQPFRPSQTVLKPFAKSATEDVEVPMMRNRIGCDYDRGENFSAVKLSYMSSASMRVILPDRGLTVNEVLKSADFTKLLSRKLRLVGEQGTVELPRWGFSGEMNLVPLLTALGVRRANEADGIEIDLFEGGPAVERIYARQSTFIEVNESGTEARAMTAFLAEACDSVPMPPFEFIADRPFLYVLESMDGIPLFMGVVSDPTRQ